MRDRLDALEQRASAGEFSRSTPLGGPVICRYPAVMMPEFQRAVFDAMLDPVTEATGLEFTSSCRRSWCVRPEFAEADDPGREGVVGRLCGYVQATISIVPAAPGRSSGRRRTPDPREHMVDRLVAKADWRMICYTGSAGTLTRRSEHSAPRSKAEQRVAAASADRLTG